MSITIPAILMPIALTVLCLVAIWRTGRSARDYDFGAVIIAVALLGVIGLIWAGYFGILLWSKS